MTDQIKQTDMIVTPNKRSRLEIYLDVLKVIGNGTDKVTRIMYSSNLSWKPLKETLNFLIERNLIEARDVMRSKRYYITAKGSRVLEYFKKLQEKLVTK